MSLNRQNSMDELNKQFDDWRKKRIEAFKNHNEQPKGNDELRIENLKKILFIIKGIATPFSKGFLRLSGQKTIRRLLEQLSVIEKDIKESNYKDANDLYQRVEFAVRPFVDQRNLGGIEFCEAITPSYDKLNNQAKPAEVLTPGPKKK